ncbi:MAG: hypothetical protein ACRDRQ_20360 [Pseudonocardiaceae bacterium]
MSPSMTRNLSRTAIAIGALGALLLLGVIVASFAWPVPSPMTMADLAEVTARTRLLGRIGLAGFVLIQLSNSLSAVVSPRIGQGMLCIGLGILWVGMIGLLDLLPGLWIWYSVPMIIGSLIINDVVPRAIHWLRDREAPETAR